MMVIMVTVILMVMVVVVMMVIDKCGDHGNGNVNGDDDR